MKRKRKCKRNTLTYQELYVTVRALVHYYRAVGVCGGVEIAINLFQKKSIAWLFTDLEIHLCAVNSFPLCLWGTTVIKANTSFRAPPSKKIIYWALAALWCWLLCPSPAASGGPTLLPASDFQTPHLWPSVALLCGADCWLSVPGGFQFHFGLRLYYQFPASCASYQSFCHCSLRSGL